MYIHICIHQVHGIHFTILIKHFKYNIYIYKYNVSLYT